MLELGVGREFLSDGFEERVQSLSDSTFEVLRRQLGVVSSRKSKENGGHVIISEIPFNVGETGISN